MTSRGAGGGGQRRAIFAADTGQALEALRMAWRDAYAVRFDDAPGPGGLRWRAWRLDSSGDMITGTTPDDLNAAITADCAAGDTR